MEGEQERLGGPGAYMGSFNPAMSQVFRFGKWHYAAKNGRLDLHYALFPGVEFVETIRFPRPTAWPEDGGRRQALERAFGLIHLLAGVSYYKCACPQRIELVGAGIDRTLAGFLQSVYSHGLAEFAYCNDLHLPQIHFPATNKARPAKRQLNLSRRALVPLGGGKDSLVSVEILRQLQESMAACVVGESALILATAEQAGLETIQIRRRIDPRLFALNQRGAYNGHVPITAIISAIAVAAALLYDYDSVVMSNERSADEPNLYRDGQPVNHQWSKGSAFEGQFQAILASHVGAGLNYFSLLRPLSEMAIIRRFAKHPRYHPHFSSCNGNFRIDSPTPGSRWCGNCPKCRFVFLGMATQMTPKALLEIFKINLLDDRTQLSGFQALAGLGACKPFECVGSCAESRWAFRELEQAEDWRHCAVVREMHDAMAATPEVPGAEPWIEADSGDLSAIPQRFRYEF